MSSHRARSYEPSRRPTSRLPKAPTDLAVWVIEQCGGEPSSDIVINTLSCREMAATLGRSPGTIQKHLKVLDGFGVRSGNEFYPSVLAELIDNRYALERQSNKPRHLYAVPASGATPTLLKAPNPLTTTARLIKLLADFPSRTSELATAVLDLEPTEYIAALMRQAIEDPKAHGVYADLALKACDAPKTQSRDFPCEDSGSRDQPRDPSRDISVDKWKPRDGSRDAVLTKKDYLKDNNNNLTTSIARDGSRETVARLLKPLVEMQRARSSVSPNLEPVINVVLRKNVSPTQLEELVANLERQFKTKGPNEDLRPLGAVFNILDQDNLKAYLDGSTQSRPAQEDNTKVAYTRCTDCHPDTNENAHPSGGHIWCPKKSVWNKCTKCDCSGITVVDLTTEDSGREFDEFAVPITREASF